MKKSIKSTANEARNILADASVAEIHPSTIEKPKPGAPIKLRLMHAVHTALLQSGKLARKNHERKQPSWPVRGEEITTLGYGAEKVSYKVSDSDTGSENVVSVYHLASMQKDPQAVIEEKQAAYRTYKKYFGELVLPTHFMIIDNPWGEGGKAAYVQPYVDSPELFGELGEDELRSRSQADPDFAHNLETLVTGYHAMVYDGLCPDFATSNLFVAGSDIVIFDIGSIYSAEKTQKMKNTHPVYELIENLGSPEPAK